MSDKTYGDAITDLHTAIATLADMLAPRLDADGDYDRESGAVPPNITLSEWVLVSTWIDMDSGRCFAETDAPFGTLSTHIMGMLLKALDNQRKL